MCSQGRTSAPRVDPGATYNGATGSILARRHLLEGQALLRILRMLEHAVLIYDFLHRTFPGLRGPLTHLPLDVLGRFICCPPRLERNATTASDGGETHRIRVPNRGAN